MAACVIIGAGVAAMRLFYHRGEKDSEIVKALQDNTKSNQEVAGELRDFKAETLKTLMDHSWEIKILKSEVSAIKDNHAP